MAGGLHREIQGSRCTCGPPLPVGRGATCDLRRAAETVYGRGERAAGHAAGGCGGCPGVAAADRLGIWPQPSKPTCRGCEMISYILESALRNRALVLFGAALLLGIGLWAAR